MNVKSIKGGVEKANQILDNVNVNMEFVRVLVPQSQVPQQKVFTTSMHNSVF